METIFHKDQSEADTPAPIDKQCRAPEHTAPSFLLLPPEIRTTIYMNVVTGTHINVLSQTDQTTRKCTALLYVCRQLRQEYTPILFANATVGFHIFDFDFAPMHDFLTKYRDGAVTALAKNPSLTIQLNFEGEMNLKWLERIRAWCWSQTPESRNVTGEDTQRSNEQTRARPRSTLNVRYHIVKELPPCKPGDDIRECYSHNVQVLNAFNSWIQRGGERTGTDADWREILAATQTKNWWGVLAASQCALGNAELLLESTCETAEDLS